jgi:hypothetical protein
VPHSRPGSRQSRASGRRGLVGAGDPAGAREPAEQAGVILADQFPVVDEEAFALQQQVVGGIVEGHVDEDRALGWPAQMHVSSRGRGSGDGDIGGPDRLLWPIRDVDRDLRRQLPDLCGECRRAQGIGVVRRHRSQGGPGGEQLQMGACLPATPEQSHMPHRAEATHGAQGGEVEKSIQLSAEAVTISRSIDSARSEAQSLYRQAEAYLKCDKLEDAAAAYRQVLRVVGRNGDMLGMAYATCGLGESQLGVSRLATVSTRTWR